MAEKISNIDINMKSQILLMSFYLYLNGLISFYQNKICYVKLMKRYYYRHRLQRKALKVVKAGLFNDF